MRVLGSIASVVASIDAEADDQAERFRRESRDSVGSLLRQPDEALELPERESRLLDAHRQARRLLGEEQALDRSERIEARERWLRGIVAEAAERLQRKIERPLLERLAREALSKLPAVPCQLVVPRQGSTWFGPEWCQAVAGESGKQSIGVMAAPEFLWGCIARTADGRIEYDNRAEARARRLEPLWRKALLEIYEAST